MDTLVFDTGPLSHFARADLLGVLKVVVGERRAVIPDAVVAELHEGVHLNYRIRAVLEADWIERRAIDTDAAGAAFARFASRLVDGERNIGEAEVLALADTMPARAVIDDSVAHKIGKRAGVDCTRTLALLCDAVRTGLLTVEYVGRLADELLVTEYRLPFRTDGFARWAADNNLFPEIAGRQL